MKAAVQPHNLLNRGLAEPNAVVLLQVALYPEPASIAVPALNLQHGVQRAQAGFPVAPVCDRRTVLHPVRFACWLLRLCHPAPQPFDDRTARTSEQMRNGLFPPARDA